MCSETTQKWETLSIQNKSREQKFSENGLLFLNAFDWSDIVSEQCRIVAL